MKKKPDKYRVIKCSLKRIIKDDSNISEFVDVCSRTHKLVIHTYQFLRLWILSEYHKNNNLPLISEDTIRMAFKVLLKDSAGPKPKDEKLILFNNFVEFYEENYKNLAYEEKLDGKHLSQILSYTATDMLTNIENNIKLNFTAYVNRFVNSCFKRDINDQLEESSNKKELREKLKKELYEIKQDLINDTNKSEEKYHEWINKHKVNIFPTEYKLSREFEIENNPQKYLKGMIYMCLEIEKLGTKAFQFFPLRTNMIMKYIPIDTKTLIELFKKNKNEYLMNIEKYKSEIWQEIFDTEKKTFRQKNYTFDYMIMTDCLTVSIQFIHKDEAPKEQQKKANIKKKRQENKELDKETKDKIKKDKINKEEKTKIEKKEKKDKNKKEFKALPKEEQKKKIEEQRKKEVEEEKELPYLEELTNEQYEDLKLRKWVVIDEGMKNILYINNEEGEKEEPYRYTCRTHLKRTRRIKYQKRMQKYKKEKGISEEENKLSEYKSKTCKIEEFKEYIKKKNEICEKILEKYMDEKFRKYKWYGYIQKRRTEEKVIKELKERYGTETIFCMGDWSKGTKNIKRITVPNKGIRKKIRENFKVYLIDEYNTSKLHHKTEEKCENMYIKDRKGVERKRHSILTYKTEKGRMGCINRDRNATRNMIKIVKSYIERKERPERYRRTKASNLHSENERQIDVSPLGSIINSPEKCLSTIEKVNTLQKFDFRCD
jgi:hypothetical protein